VVEAIRGRVRVAEFQVSATAFVSVFYGLGALRAEDQFSRIIGQRSGGTRFLAARVELFGGECTYVVATAAHWRQWTGRIRIIADFAFEYRSETPK